MKKFLVMILAVISTSAFAGGTVYNSKEYDLEKTADIDPRIIEFTPKGYPHMACIYVTGGNDGGVTCFPKKPERKKVWECEKQFTTTVCKEK